MPSGGWISRHRDDESIRRTSERVKRERRERNARRRREARMQRERDAAQAARFMSRGDRLMARYAAIRAQETAQHEEEGGGVDRTEQR